MEDFCCVPSGDRWIDDEGGVVLGVAAYAGQPVCDCVRVEASQPGGEYQPEWSDGFCEEESVVPLPLIERHEEPSRSTGDDAFCVLCCEEVAFFHWVEILETRFHFESVVFAQRMP